jgi:hypothetical protein
VGARHVVEVLGRLCGVGGMHSWDDAPAVRTIAISSWWRRARRSSARQAVGRCIVVSCVGMLRAHPSVTSGDSQLGQPPSGTGAGAEV